ncbi:DNA_pol_B_2 domain-containing protein [Trichonephila clavata]|uniref:DNA_pol_B_2 domain-containing protein n=1 Tax=Trichonephila clavata TaxID=2740835 RepID=A0A8X6HT12_TRICU|nr:DNA_pol_B_2 domain-containing protein [Trichonephila clavata]
MSLNGTSQAGTFTDLVKHLLIKRGLRGDISIFHRFCSANNKYLDSYDETKPSKYILHFKANNLYEWAMSQHLPTYGFDWITEPVDFMEILDEPNIGYAFEVDRLSTKLKWFS